jgi:hypothetical protein
MANKARKDEYANAMRMAGGRPKKTTKSTQYKDQSRSRRSQPPKQPVAPPKKTRRA